MSFINELFSPSGKISSKRVIGTVTLMLVMGCVIYLTISEGGTRAVEDLLQTAMILAAALLGISNVTSIWKNGSVSYNQKTEDTQEQPVHEPTPLPENPPVNDVVTNTKKPRKTKKNNSTTDINMTTNQVIED